MRSSFRLLTVLAIAIVSGWLLFEITSHFISRTPEKSALPTNANRLYAASFPDDQGKSQALGQWRNHVAVVNFWASWCPPCREEMPELDTLYKKYQAQGLIVLGVSTDNLSTLRDSAKESPVSYPLVAGNDEAMQLATAMGNDKDILPYTLLIAKDGHIVSAYFGRLDMNKLEQDLRPLLR